MNDLLAKSIIDPNDEHCSSLLTFHTLPDKPKHVSHIKEFEQLVKTNNNILITVML